MDGKRLSLGEPTSPADSRSLDIRRRPSPVHSSPVRFVVRSPPHVPTMSRWTEMDSVEEPPSSANGSQPFRFVTSRPFLIGKFPR